MLGLVKRNCLAESDDANTTIFGFTLSPWGISSVGRVLPLQGSCQWFEPVILQNLGDMAEW